MKYLLYEDDCAPDAREYFDKDMKEKYNIGLHDFKMLGRYVEVDNGMTLEWHLLGHVLEISADDPYYKLRKEDE